MTGGIERPGQGTTTTVSVHSLDGGPDGSSPEVLELVNVTVPGRSSLTWS